MKIWWVNLGKRYEAQRSKSVLWCPNKTVHDDKSLSEPAWHWQIVEEIEPGEFIVLCKKGKIMGLAVAVKRATPDQAMPWPKLDGDTWHDQGWLLKVKFLEFETPKSRADMTAGLFYERTRYRPLLNREGENGRGTQIYITRLKESDGDALFKRIALILDQENPGWVAESIQLNVNVKGKKKSVKTRKTVRKALINARVGQGQFRQDLLDFWKRRCCATDLDIEELLIASHIHPWSLSSDEEKLDPHNGLLLSAAYDAAFDKALITLSDNGDWINSAGLSDVELQRSGLGALQTQSVKGVSEAHHPFLALHRKRANDVRANRLAKALGQKAALPGEKL